MYVVSLVYVVHSDKTGSPLGVDLCCHQDGFPCVLRDFETGMGVQVNETQVMLTAKSKYLQCLIQSKYVQIEQNQQQRLHKHA